MVESVFNALTLQQWGYPTVACLGSSMPHGAEELFIGKQVYLVFDNDENNAGRKGAIRTSRLLYKVDVDPFIVTMPLGIDVNDYAKTHSKTDFLRLLSKKVRFSKTQEYRVWRKEEERRQRQAKFKQKDLESLERLKMIPVETILNEHGIYPENRGSLLQCRCPLPDHKDENGSFTVYTDNNKVKCFGCGFFGDSIALVAKLRNINFAEAISYLRTKYGE